ncbi:MAG: class I SAM-dependent methyltransferase [Candidatus Thiodiazotropha sp. (ex Monitilora ramsayi)]|nr:class I SAM-dependent methyltransferase [Candidatus Thiodiazotropha sp. (ex Monitilora ramsayi)]
MTIGSKTESNKEGDSKYSDYYKSNSLKVYPSEFVVRAFLGSYPKHKLDKEQIVGKSILDLGFGDGRNMQLFHNLGMDVYGIEITQEICDVVSSRLEADGVNVETRVGRNAQIPYESESFDYVLASSSCYYMDPGKKYGDNVQEIARVLKPGGVFIHSVPMPTTFIMKNSIDRGEGHMEITEDPYGVRVGYILKKFDDEDEIRESLDPYFYDIRIGSCRDDFWGDSVHLWLVVCTKK